MLGIARLSMIARLVLLGAVGIVTMGAQSSCSSGDDGGTLRVGGGGGTGTGNGPTISVTLTLKDSSGRIRDHFAACELITFELTLLNRTGAPIRMQLPTLGGNQDFQVFKPGAKDTSWDWSANKQFATVITDITIEAGGTQVFSATWDQVLADGAMLARGNYEARGQFFSVPGQLPPLTEADTRSPRVGFRVN